MNITNITDADGPDSRIGLATGLEAEFQVSDIFSLSAGAIYSQQGAKSGFSTDDIDGTLTFKLDYINVPILANVYVAKGLAVKLGIQPGFNVASKAEYKQTIGGITNKVSGDVKGLNSVDVSIPVGFSYEYANVLFDARYNWGLTKFVGDSDSNSKNSVLQITLGYKFKL